MVAHGGEHRRDCPMVIIRNGRAAPGEPTTGTSVIPALTLPLQGGDTWLGLAANSVSAHTLSVTARCHLAVTVTSPAYRPGQAVIPALRPGTLARLFSTDGRRRRGLPTDCPHRSGLIHVGLQLQCRQVHRPARIHPGRYALAGPQCRHKRDTADLRRHRSEILGCTLFKARWDIARGTYGLSRSHDAMSFVLLRL
jgi:hypothetical protein